MNKDNYALFGQPVALSPSPQIHQFFAKSLEHQIKYDKFDISQQQFSQAVKSFFSEGGKGLNITVPHKQAAYLLSDTITPAAEQAKAVNTLWMEDGKLHGDNTDGVGFINDCLAKEIQIKNKKILILGAGGAVRGIIAPLLEQKPEQIIIANRTLENAQKLAANFSSQVKISTIDLTDTHLYKVDIVINGLALHRFPEDLKMNLENDAAYYDLKYGQAAESGIHWAINQSFSFACDGWGMLVRQAAQSYLIWRHKKPSIIELINNPSNISK